MNEEPVFWLATELDHQVGVIKLEVRQHELEGIFVLAHGERAIETVFMSVFVVVVASSESFLTLVLWS